MIYRFILASEEVDNFMREIEIDADASFLDLRNAICDAVGYSTKQLASFLIYDDYREKEFEITLEDMGVDSSEDPLIMNECIISDYIEDKGQRLMYNFDFMTNRSLYMELKDSMPGKHLDAPACTLSVGNPPPETIDFDEFDAALNAKAIAEASKHDPIFDLDDDLYGSSDFDDEDLASAGISDLYDDY
ncbi:MAG: hypothetical protein J1E84_04600 [Muribaculaceae bacterium]|nr:hypothetical protein [Muribaculaceae bacterium]